MPVEVFRNDDERYVDWIDKHPGGYVINTARNPKASYLKLHMADCRLVSELQSGATTWTAGPYIKICAETRREVENWAVEVVGSRPDATCHCVA